MSDDMSPSGYFIYLFWLAISATLQSIFLLLNKDLDLGLKCTFFCDRHAITELQDQVVSCGAQVRKPKMAPQNSSLR